MHATFEVRSREHAEPRSLAAVQAAGYRDLRAEIGE